MAFLLTPHDERTKVNHFYIQYNPDGDSLSLIYIYDMQLSGAYRGYKYYFYSDHTNNKSFDGLPGFYQRYDQAEHDLSSPLYRTVIDVNKLSKKKKKKIIYKVFLGIEL
jgi:prolyl oligopeptidase PreP (S9A serine peptidase family)